MARSPSYLPSWIDTLTVKLFLVARTTVVIRITFTFDRLCNYVPDGHSLWERVRLPTSFIFGEGMKFILRNWERAIAHSLSQFNEARLFFCVLNNIGLELRQLSDGDTFPWRAVLLANLQMNGVIMGARI